MSKIVMSGTAMHKTSNSKTAVFKTTAIKTTVIKTMKRLLVLCMVVFAQPLWAGCESTILEGSHVAIKKSEALEGAWEEARDMCYPGEAQKLTKKCKKVKGEKGVQGKKAVQCTQEISCNICGDALRRKYEALGN